jgi:glycopeptide antibiotics resistance protein
MPSRPHLALGGAVIGAVLVVLLAPHHTDLPIAWLSASHLLGDAADGGTPLWWALEDLGNIALFLPLGAVLVRWLQPFVAWLVAVGASIACETAQLWIPTRHASVRDVLMNAIGAALGVALVLLLRRIARHRRSRGLALGA